MKFHVLVGIFILVFDIQEVQLQECGKPKFNSRIVGGINAQPGEWPWQVSFQKSGKHICGGSLISDSWVITAAHCLKDYNQNMDQYTVALGCYQFSHPNRNQLTMSLKQIIINEDYTAPAKGYDIALLQLSHTIAYTDYIRPICLPSSDVEFPNGLMCWVTGWGINSYEEITGQDILQEGEIPIINQPQCDCLYHVDTLYSPNYQQVEMDYICAGYIRGTRDACQGDSGGPLMCKDGDKWILAGLVSWGQSCAVTNRPGVYTHVPTFQNWLQSKISGLKFFKLSQTTGTLFYNGICTYGRNGIATVYTNSSSMVPSMAPNNSSRFLYNSAVTFHFFYKPLITIIQLLCISFKFLGTG
ncbi:serine protease 27-like [Protopterus annectens]|uniref:serine protease 27-like n=1 Tax=Protopterus annectens TaxID=7888 RepID=UPI001CFA69C8|nr:serine protease 27-like [Protopterus annectens]